MPDAIAKLLDIMRDERESPRDRINAAVSASRVEKLQLPGEEPPESVAFLRAIVEDLNVETRLRRESAAALTYFERRSKKAALTFEVADNSEQQRQWQTLTNAALRYRIIASNAWPNARDILGQDESTPPANPNLTITAMLSPPRRGAATRKSKAVDAPETTVITSEKERRVAILPLVRIAANASL